MISAPMLMLVLLLKLAFAGAFFIVLISFGLWLGRFGFVDKEVE